MEPGSYGYGCDPQKTYEGDMKEAWLDHLMYDAPQEELADVSSHRHLLWLAPCHVLLSWSGREQVYSSHEE